MGEFLVGCGVLGGGAVWGGACQIWGECPCGSGVGGGDIFATAQEEWVYIQSSMAGEMNWVMLMGAGVDNIHPSLDEILETLQTFTTRLNIFFGPFYSVLTFLSVGRTPTTAATAPALTSLALRTLAVTPLWLLLAVWPLHIITGRRVIITAGTLILSWHSRPAKVTRTILWRSLTIRWACEQLTGLSFTPAPAVPPPLPSRKNGRTPLATPNASTTSLPATISSTVSAVTIAAAKAVTCKPTPLEPGKVSSPGVRFTFVIYENQRRWLGIGWNTSLFAYERAPWTDETLEPCPPPVEFSLPHTPRGSGVKWRWVPGEDWRVDGQDMEGRKQGKKQAVKDKLGGSGVEGEGWIYYDNKVCRALSYLSVGEAAKANLRGSGITVLGRGRTVGESILGDVNGYETRNWSKIRKMSTSMLRVTSCRYHHHQCIQRHRIRWNWRGARCRL